jgi:hypothetical protein
MADGTWKKAKEVKIGEILSGGNKIVGVVIECCEDIVKLEGGGSVSSASLVHFKNMWLRAGQLMPYDRFFESLNLIQFITEYSIPIVVRNEKSTFYLRDYREVALPEMELPYSISLESIKNLPATVQQSVEVC